MKNQCTNPKCNKIIKGTEYTDQIGNVYCSVKCLNDYEDHYN